MTSGMPSMTALLGMLALAGYQNRDKISDMLRGATASTAQPGAGGQQPPLGGLLGNLGGMLGGASAGGLLSGGLGELLERPWRHCTVLGQQWSEQGDFSPRIEAGDWG